MHADAPQQPQDRWCDAEGGRITLFCKVEQVAENPEDGALFSRLHQRGEVVGRSLHLIYIRFDGESQVIGMRPHLLRVRTTENVRKGLDWS